MFILPLYDLEFVIGKKESYFPALITAKKRASVRPNGGSKALGRMRTNWLAWPRNVNALPNPY